MPSTHRRGLKMSSAPRIASKRLLQLTRLAQKRKVERRKLLFRAVKYGNEGWAKALLDKLIGSHEHLESINRYRHTLLHVNAITGNAVITRHLLDAGFNIDAQECDGNTALHVAILKGHESTARCLIEAGANVNARNAEGMSLLHCAALKDDAQMTRLLIALGTGTETRDNSGYTALHTAVSRFSFTALGILLNNGANVNAEDHEGITILMFANVLVSRVENSAANKRKLIKTLLEAGADFNQPICVTAVSDKFVTTFELALAVDTSVINVAKMITEHAAKMKEAGKQLAFSQRNLKSTKLMPAIEAHYESCLGELRVMKTQKIDATTVSFFAVLTNDLDTVARYTRNEKLVWAFETGDYEASFPIYKEQLREKFHEACERRQLIESAAIVLSDILRITDPRHVAFEIILKYLNSEDMHLLVNKI